MGRDGDTGHTITDYRGLARRQPVLALAFAVLLLGQAGVPFTTGFLAKFGVVGAVVATHAYALAAIAMVTAAIAVFFYLRVAVAMYSPVGAVADPVDERTWGTRRPGPAGSPPGSPGRVRAGLSTPSRTRSTGVRPDRGGDQPLGPHRRAADRRGHRARRGAVPAADLGGPRPVRRLHRGVRDHPRAHPRTSPTRPRCSSPDRSPSGAPGRTWVGGRDTTVLVRLRPPGVLSSGRSRHRRGEGVNHGQSSSRSEPGVDPSVAGQETGATRRSSGSVWPWSD